jgi:agmatinase
MSVGSINPTGPFLDLPPQYCDPATAAVCLLPVPYDATTSYQPGARFGPAALIAASHQVEMFDEYLQRETYRIGIATVPPVPPNVAGPEAMVAEIRRACEDLLARGKFIAMVGGEHTVTLGALDALRRRRAGRPFGVVQFDAHRDLRASFEECAYSHACVTARVVDWGLPVLQLGVRAWSREEQDRLDGGGLPVVALTARELTYGNPVALLERALAHLPDEIYLTFDLDVLDPSIMPATGTPEPGGLGWYPTLDLLEAVTARRRVIGLDVVELRPIAGFVAPDVLAARLLYRLLGLITRDFPTL